MYSENNNNTYFQSSIIFVISYLYKISSKYGQIVWAVADYSRHTPDYFTPAHNTYYSILILRM